MNLDPERKNRVSVQGKPGTPPQYLPGIEGITPLFLGINTKFPTGILMPVSTGFPKKDCTRMIPAPVVHGPTLQFGIFFSGHSDKHRVRSGVTFEKPDIILP